LAFLRTCQDGENALRPTFLPEKTAEKVGHKGLDFKFLTLLLDKVPRDVDGV
jgi:hypothetical protein